MTQIGNRNLGQFCIAYNSSVQPTTGFTPYYWMFRTTLVTKTTSLMHAEAFRKTSIQLMSKLELKRTLNFSVRRPFMISRFMVILTRKVTWFGYIQQWSQKDARKNCTTHHLLLLKGFQMVCIGLDLQKIDTSRL